MVSEQFKRVAKVISAECPALDVYALLDLTDKVMRAVGGPASLIEQALDSGRIRDYCRDSKKILAIKELRAISGCSLRDAKDAIESDEVWGAYAPRTGVYVP